MTKCSVSNSVFQGPNRKKNWIQFRWWCHQQRRRIAFHQGIWPKTWVDPSCQNAVEFFWQPAIKKSQTLHARYASAKSVCIGRGKRRPQRSSWIAEWSPDSNNRRSGSVTCNSKYPLPVRKQNKRSSLYWVEPIVYRVLCRKFYHPAHELILDFDATDDLTYRMQEKRFFHGYYDYYLFSSALGVLWRSITLRLSLALKDGCGQAFPGNSFSVGETTP